MLRFDTLTGWSKSIMLKLSRLDISFSILCNPLFIVLIKRQGHNPLQKVLYQFSFQKSSTFWKSVTVFEWVNNLLTNPIFYNFVKVRAIKQAFKLFIGNAAFKTLFTLAYDGLSVKGSRATRIPLINITEYATAEIVHFHLPFLYIFAWHLHRVL